jgi:hypothetical protein
MEDYHTATSTETEDGRPVGLFAVYDGHGGRRCVRYVRSKLFDAILGHPTFKQGDVEAAMISGFLTVRRHSCVLIYPHSMHAPLLCFDLSTFNASTAPVF